MKSKKIALLIVLLAGFNLYSQTPSAYSAFNFGLLNEFTSTRSIGLSSTGVSLDDADYLNQVNPAALSRIELTKVEAFANANGMFMAETGLNKYYAYAALGGLSLAFPIYKPYGIGLMLGLSPYSIARYDMKSVSDANPYLNAATTTTSLRGGLSDLHISASFLGPYDFRLGLKFHHLFGNTTYNSEVTFGNSEVASATYGTEYEDHGNMFSIGLLSPDFQTAGIENIRFGLVLDLKGTVKSDTFLVRTASTVNDTLSSGTGSTTIPMNIIAGVSFSFLQGYRGMVEYAYQDWTSATGFRVDQANTRKLQRFSASIEYRPLKDQSFDFTKPAYRGGFSYEQLPLLINGTGINQFSFSLGASFPVSYQNHIDLGVAYGIRGTTDNDLLKEHFVRFSLGISLGELWFVQQER